LEIIYIKYAIIFIFLLELFLHYYVNYIRDQYVERVDWHQGRLITNIITFKDKLPKIDRKRLYGYLLHFYDSEIGSVTKPNTGNIEKHETKTKKIITTSYSIDSTGSRTNPGHDHLETLIESYGDSICFGRHANDNETWQYYLSKKLNHHVRNLAVGNYGIDQALLRFKRDIENDLDGSIIIFCVAPETIRRSLSIWKHLYEFGNTLSFKPRYRLNNGDLSLIKNPVDVSEKFKDIGSIFNSFKNNDEYYTLKFKKYLWEFPYSISLFRNSYRKLTLLYYFSFHLFYEKFNKDWTKSWMFPSKSKTMNGIKNLGGLYFDFQDKLEMYRTDNFVDLTSKIIEEFNHTAKRHNKIPILVMIPAHYDFEYIKDTGQIYYDSLINSAKKFMDVVDVGSSLLENYKDQSLYSEQGFGAHLSPRGNEIVAEVIYNYLETNILRKL